MKNSRSYFNGDELHEHIWNYTTMHQPCIIYYMLQWCGASTVSHCQLHFLWHGKICSIACVCYKHICSYLFINGIQCVISSFTFSFCVFVVHFLIMMQRYMSTGIPCTNSSFQLWTSYYSVSYQDLSKQKVKNNVKKCEGKLKFLPFFECSKFISSQTKDNKRTKQKTHRT